MTAPTLDALVTPVTPEEALASELTQAALLGLDTTAWQPVSPSRTILAIIHQNSRASQRTFSPQTESKSTYSRLCVLHRNFPLRFAI